MSTSPADALEFIRPGREQVPALAKFLEELAARGEERWFHPHPLTVEAAVARADYAGRDYYCLAMAGERVLAYAMLRGWDEGYAVPSLGIAVRADARGLGLGRAMMAVLHAEARRRGAPSIRLKVYPENAAAVELYRSLGYVYAAERVDGQLVGTKALP